MLLTCFDFISRISIFWSSGAHNQEYDAPSLLPFRGDYLYVWNSFIAINIDRFGEWQEIIEEVNILVRVRLGE